MSILSASSKSTLALLFKVMLVFGALLIALVGCKRCEDAEVPLADDPTPPGATAYTFQSPPFFPPLDVPDDNAFTEEGIDLGRHLFWEKSLSGDFTISCGTCHAPSNAFSDPNQFSTGIDGIAGTRNSMALVNVGWANDYFWDGRAPDLETQILEPVENPIEMHLAWTEAVLRLEDMPIYQEKFDLAFGPGAITKEKTAKAMAQFIRTLVSAGSRYDQDRLGMIDLSDSESRGLELFLTECGNGFDGADCFHCHSLAGLQFTDYQPHNNGLDADFTDLGYGGVNGNSQDNGKFKTPTLRNVEFSAPYMHDGRFQTLEEVVEHYNSGIQQSATLDPFIECGDNDLNLSEEDKVDLVNFLKSLSDPDFITNPDFSDPHL